MNMNNTHSNPIILNQIDRFQFKINFEGNNTSMIVDEPEPYGKNSGPSPEQLLCAAVANCMSNSLYSAINRKNPDPAPLTTIATAILGRNAENRLRIQAIEVSIKLGKSIAELGDLEQALARFEDFCTVASSVNQGIPVKCRITDCEGAILKNELDDISDFEDHTECSIDGTGCSCGCGMEH